MDVKSIFSLNLLGLSIFSPAVSGPRGSEAELHAHSPNLMKEMLSHLPKLFSRKCPKCLENKLAAYARQW